MTGEAWLLGSPQRIGLLVGPARAGKTRTLRAVVAAWHEHGGHVLGLTVSQAAAGVLAGEAQVWAENTAKWLHETRRAGGKVLLVGDPAQLAAIGRGGAFALLADRHGAAHLHEVRRFLDAWEADASLQLRRRDPTCIAEYAMRGRIHAGTREQRAVTGSAGGARVITAGSPSVDVVDQRVTPGLPTRHQADPREWLVSFRIQPGRAADSSRPSKPSAQPVMFLSSPAARASGPST